MNLKSLYYSKYNDLCDHRLNTVYIPVIQCVIIIYFVNFMSNYLCPAKRFRIKKIVLRQLEYCVLFCCENFTRIR